jgi:hypothetical protein
MSGEFDMPAMRIFASPSPSLWNDASPCTTRDLAVDMSDVTVIDAGSVRVLLKAWEAR